MIIFIYLFIVTAVTLILWSILGARRVSARLPQLSQEAKQTKRIKRYSFICAIFPFAPLLLQKLKLEAKIKDKLDAAHIRLIAPEFFNLKLILMLFLGVLSFFAVGKLDPLVLTVALVLGYILPDLWLNRKIAQRKYTIARLLPEAVDLLGLCVEAGLDFTAAAKWIIEKVPTNPMIEELAFVLEEIRWGKPRIQALKDMARRLNIPEVSSFVQTLVQAERMGTPVSEAFVVLSEDTRLQRFHQGERYAMQAPIKILIPLIFCILPVIAIIVGGPIFLQFMSGGLFKGLGR